MRGRPREFRCCALDGGGGNRGVAQGWSAAFGMRMPWVRFPPPRLVTDDKLLTMDIQLRGNAHLGSSVTVSFIDYSVPRNQYMTYSVLNAECTGSLLAPDR